MSMTESEALRDLASMVGWELLVQHVRAEVQTGMTRVLNDAARMDPAELGQRVKQQQAVTAALLQLVAWPIKRATELDAQDGRGPRVLDMRTR